MTTTRSKQTFRFGRFGLDAADDKLVRFGEEPMGLGGKEEQDRWRGESATSFR